MFYNDYGLKEHSAEIQPTMNIDTSAKKHQIVRNRRCYIPGLSLLHKTLSKLPTSTYTTTVAEGLIAATMQRKSCHTCKRVDLCLFQDSSEEDCNNDGDVI